MENVIKIDHEHEKMRDEAIIMYEKRNEMEIAWKEYENNISRQPAKIIVIVKKHGEIQADSLPF